MKKFYFLMLAAFACIAANAATVYFQNTGNWAEVYAYTFGGGSENAKWPGEAVTESVKVSSENGEMTLYKYETTNETIIFNNNNNGIQTKDLKATDGAVYTADNANSLDPIGTVKDGVFTPAGEVEITYATIYVPVSEYNKEKCYIYSWTPVIFGGWPGAEMTKVTEDGVELWSVKVDNRELAKVEGWKLHNNAGNETNNFPSVTFQDNYVYKSNGKSMTLADYIEEVKNGGGDEPEVDAEWYVSLNYNSAGWNHNFPMGKEEDGSFRAHFGETTASANYITIHTGKMSDWTVSNGVRYGSGDADAPVDETSTLPMVEGSDKCWILGPSAEGWTIKVDPKNLMISFDKGATTGVEGVEADNNEAVEYFNLQGVRVENPANGLFIRRQGNKVTKVLVK